MADRRGMTFEQVREIMLALPGIVEGMSYGTPAFRVGKKFMSRLREEDVLVLTPVDDAEQRFLMETQPQVYFLTDHYRGYPAILVRLSKARCGDVREIVERCWNELATAKMRAARDHAPPHPSRARRGAR